MAMAAILLVPGAATAWMAWEKFILPVPPAPLPLSLAGTGALAINLFCAFLLARFRTHAGSLTRAAWLSARNDALANIAIIAAGFVTAMTLSAWPDLIVGLGIFAINLDAAREVYVAARAEQRVLLPSLERRLFNREIWPPGPACCRDRVTGMRQAGIARDDGERECGYNAAPRPVSNESRPRPLIGAQRMWPA